MQDSYDLSEFAKLKVILVPISPQKKESFQEYLDIFRNISSVPLDELSPPDSHSAKYNKEFYHPGTIHYDFVTSYNRDLSQLEEIEISRQIFGVIGIINCQQVGDLFQGFKQFQNIAQRYPTALVQRCFAFQPKDNQRDDIKGLIMIPHTGDTKFYLQTMLNDFTADMLLAISLMAGQLELKTSIIGPVIISPFFSKSQTNSDSSNTTTTLVPVEGNGLMPPGTPARNSSDNPASNDASPPQILTSVNNAEKVKKRTPARAQKLLGDLYLLAGRLDKAMECFVNAIEGAKLNNDLQWQASASEGYICTQLVTLLRAVDPNHGLSLSSGEILEFSKKSKLLFSFICELPERYRELVSLYDKSQIYGVIGYYPLLQIQASLRIANFLSHAFLVPFNGTFINCAGISWSHQAKSLTAELTLRMVKAPNQTASVSSTLIPQQSSAQTEKAILQNGTGVTRLDILTWITRISLTGNEYLTLKDYITVLAGICSVCLRIKAYRKYAFYLRLLGVSTRKLSYQQLDELSLKRWSLVAIHRVCDLLESPDPAVCSSEEDVLWLETYGRAVTKPDSPWYSTEAPAPYSYSLRYGWPSLRIALLKEAIMLADQDEDHTNTIVFTAKLLRKFFRYLGRNEQQNYSNILFKVVQQHRKKLAANPENPPLLQFQDSVVLGAPLLLKMNVVALTARYHVTQHFPIKAQSSVKQAFLYSPFAKKKAEQKDIIVTANEMVHVDITLANPFMFEIDVQSMVLCSGSGGVSFKPLSISTLIPAETSSHVIRLSCIPLEAGILNLTGITTRMLGGCIEETFKPLQRHLSDPDKFTPQGMLRTQSEQEKAGKKQLEFVSISRPKKLKEQAEWSLSVTVIEPQPLLELLETSLGSHQAITLFEGEKSSLSFTIRNIGFVPINYIFFSINDSVSPAEVVPGDHPNNTYESEVYQKHIRAFYPLFGDQTNSDTNVGVVHQMTRIGELGPVKLDKILEPGEQTTVSLGVFGKKNCCGCLVQVSYGNVSTESNQPDHFCTRELEIPFLLTVVSALSFRNVDALCFTSDDTAPESPSALVAVTEKSMFVEEVLLDPRLSTASGVASDENNTFLFTFDLYNEWDEPFKVSFEIYNDSVSGTPSCTSSTILHAGVRKRIILPIDRFLISEKMVQRPIPKAQGKQFIAASTKTLSKITEGMSRALFWYKEEFIGGLLNRGRLIVKWACSQGRNGVLLFREFEFLPRYIPIMKSDGIVIEAFFDESDAVVKLGKQKYQCTKHSSVTLCWKITNYLESKIRLIFRAFPASKCVGREIFFVGSPNRLLDPIDVGESLTFKNTILISTAGNYHIVAQAEKMQEARAPVIKRSKYEAPEIILEDIEDVFWFKGIFIHVVD